MTMKVARPAFTSVPTVVPRSVSLKKESRPPPPPLGCALSLRGTSVAVTRGHPPLHGAPGYPTPLLGTGAAAQPTPRKVRSAAGFRGSAAQEEVRENGQHDAHDDH